ncbi:TonB-dependent receptor plug domain-containing protein, partial [Hymenobacter coccineus]|uniref:TonB-dependent receptor plug domain-containing protein n=1 Tax=Hymenobacter coccineus TaxID=1908235 RepID=UPI000A731375
PWPRGPCRRCPRLPSPAEAGALRGAQAQVAADRRFRRDTSKTILLGNVSVRGRKAVVMDSRRIYNPLNATVLRLDDPAFMAVSNLTLFQVLQGRIPGVNVTGAEPNMVVQVRGPSSMLGNNQPLFVLDGLPVDQDVLSFFPARDAEAIEVLKGTEAAVYGSRAAGGVIAVYTRRGAPNYQPSMELAPGILAVYSNGYACPRQFYQPRYDRPQPATAAPADPRHRTLYWNPDVRTNAAGEAALTFYTADAAGRFQLVAQGVSAARQPALGRGALQVAPRP